MLNLDVSAVYSMCNIILMVISGYLHLISFLKKERLLLVYYLFIYYTLFILKKIIIHYMHLVFIVDVLNLHLSGGLEDIHVKDG